MRSLRSVRELDRERLSVEERHDPVDRPGEGVAFQRVPAHRLLERDAANDALEDPGERLRRGLAADLLQGDDAVALDAQIGYGNARLLRESLRRLGGLSVLEGSLRGRALQGAAHVRRALGDGSDHQRQAARGRVFLDVGPLRLAFAVEARVVEAAVHLRGHPFQRRLLEPGG